MARSRRVVIVDDSATQCAVWRSFLEERYGQRVAVEVYTDPTEALDHLGPSVHILLLDWEMPKMDGRAVFEEACLRGVNPKRIIISSAHPAGTLHEQFDGSGCLAVIEKTEPEQQAAFLMILDSIMRR